MSLSWPAWMGSDALVSHVVSVLIGAAVRGAILLLLAAVVVRLWPRASAAQRHVVWAVACCSLLLLPVLPLVVPAWQVSVPVLPATVTPVVNRVQEAPPHPVALTAGAVSHHTTVEVHKPAGQLLSEAGWLMLFLGVWGSGTVVSLAVLADSQRRVRRLVSEALPLTDAHMRDVLTRARSTVRVTRRVPVKLHASTVPMMCGILWPTIVLPVTSRTWSEDRLYNILLHELAHIKRYDCLTQAVAFLACALYWFNPLVWLGMRRLQTEQEQACDDVVLRAGSRPRGYATDLLELTQVFQSTRALSLAALPFARPSELQTRMQSIVDRCRYRSAMSRWGVLAVWGAGMGVMYPLIGITPHMRPAEIRPYITTMENGKMNRIKRTAMVASAAAGLLARAPALSQAQVPARTERQVASTEAWDHRDGPPAHIYSNQVDSLYKGAKTPQDSARRFFKGPGAWWNIIVGGKINDLGDSIKWIDFYTRFNYDAAYPHVYADYDGGRSAASNTAEPNRVRDSVLVLVDGVRQGVFPINGRIPFDQLKHLNSDIRDQLNLDTRHEYHVYRGGHWAVVLYGPDAANGVIDIMSRRRRT